MVQLLQAALFFSLLYTVSFGVSFLVIFFSLARCVHRMEIMLSLEVEHGKSEDTP